MIEAAFTYESAKLAGLMREYSKLKTIGECRVWANQAHAVASYISDAITKTDEFILVQQDRLEQEKNKPAQTNMRINIMELTNFKHILERQLGELIKIIESLPNGPEDSEPVKLPRRQIYAVRLNGPERKKRPFLGSLLLMIIALGIFVLIMMYLSSL
jgi:hypothetical protein